MKENKPEEDTENLFAATYRLLLHPGNKKWVAASQCSVMCKKTQPKLSTIGTSQLYKVKVKLKAKAASCDITETFNSNSTDDVKLNIRELLNYTTSVSPETANDQYFLL